MRSRTANWFICKIRYDKTMEDGLQKKVTEQYVVDALSFSEAEARIIEEMSHYISGEFDVHEIDRCVFKEIFFSDNEMADKWYKAKLKFITIDEKTEKEKKTLVYYLVQAGSFEGARKNIDEVMGGTMIDYIIDTVSETKIMDVFEYVAKEKNDIEPTNDGMTDKVQKILNEIQTRKLCTMDEHMAFYSKEAEADYRLLCELEEYIKSMQEESVSEDLEIEIKHCIYEPFFDLDGVAVKGATKYLTVEDIADIARHFAIWQKQKDQETIELAEDHAMLAGMEKMKEQLLKDAVSATVITDPDAHGADYGLQKLDVKFKELESKGFKSGTKVKLIIIKED